MCVFCFFKTIGKKLKTNKCPVSTDIKQMSTTKQCNSTWVNAKKPKPEPEPEPESDEDEEEEKGDWCYGTTVSLSKTYIMAGGSCHWWNYVVEFDVDTGEQKSVYIESKNSKEKQDGYYLFVDEDGNRLALELECPGGGWTILDHPI